jgi:hypothetical protein
MNPGWVTGNMRAALTSVTCSIRDPVLVRFSLKVAHVLPMSYRQSSDTPRGRCKPTMVSQGREQFPPLSNSRCAERIRYRYLSQLQDSEDPQVGLLHRMAMDIAGNCGHTLLKAHRLAWGWTVTEAVDAFHQMCRREHIKPRGLVARSWLDWEAGSRPNWDYQDLLSRLFTTSPVHLGWAADYTPAEPPAARRPPPAGSSPPPTRSPSPGEQPGSRNSSPVTADTAIRCCTSLQTPAISPAGPSWSAKSPTRSAPRTRTAPPWRPWSTSPRRDPSRVRHGAQPAVIRKRLNHTDAAPSTPITRPSSHAGSGARSRATGTLSSTAGSRKRGLEPR